MNPQSRRVATPSPSLKRKETTDHFRPSPVLTKSLKPPPPRNGSAHGSKSSFPGSLQTTRPSFTSAHLSKPAATAQAIPKPNNLIFAGYMAHEFLTKGTVLGENIDTALPIGPAKMSSRLIEPIGKAEERYAEVCRLLKTDGSHIPGIVNPTQLARYLNR